MSFFSKIESFFEKLGTASFEQKVESTLTVCASLLLTTIGLAKGSTVEGKVASVANQAISDFAAVSAVASSATSGGASKPTVSSILTAVQSNLGTLVSDADVKNSSKAAEVTTTATTVINEIEAILKAV